MIIDSHCHLHLLDLSDDELTRVVEKAQEAGVREILSVSVDLLSLPSLLDIAERFPGVWASAGVHPSHAPNEVLDESRLMDMLGHRKVVAVGETGLDYFYNKGDLAWQRNRFRQQIRVASRVGKPLIVHTRDGLEDTIRILNEEQGGQLRGVIHCFTEDWMAAKAFMDLGFYISFSGIVTFKNAETLRDVARRMPLDRILVETDAPYLTPVPYRGKPNRPAYVRQVAECIAGVRGMTLQRLAEATTANFHTLFSEVTPSF